MGTFVSELRRRHVFRVAAAYAVVAWLVIQVAGTTLPAFDAPAWVLRVVIAAAVLGFPLALVLAWAYELTPDGVRRTDRAETVAEGGAPSKRGRRWTGREAGWMGVGMLVGLTTVAAYAVMGDSAGGAGAAGPRSLAVLPFENVGPEEEQLFARGISEEILNTLSGVEGLRVAARTSAFSFSGSAVPIDSVARALNVDYVLEGSVRTVGQQVRIAAQLIDAATGHEIWSQSYNRESSGLLALQEEIAVAIANALQVELAGSSQALLARNRIVDPVAYEAYIQGRHLASTRQRDSLRLAITRFETALSLDPAFAAAYSGLADAYSLLEDVRGITREEAFPKAVAAAKRALELDDLQAEAHASLGHIFYHQKSWEAAEREYLRAMELNPSYATAFHWYANLLLAIGREPQALEAIERAYELDPLSKKIGAVRAMMLYFNGDAEAAMAVQRDRIRADPDDVEAWYSLGWTQMTSPRPADAIQTVEQMMARIPEGQPNAWALSRLAAAYAAAGRHAEAGRLLADAEKSPAGHNPTALAAAYLFQGDEDRTFAWLEKAVAAEHWMLPLLPSDPVFEPLRRDARFAKIQRQIRF